MEVELSIKQLEKRLSAAWEKKLKKEGFESAGSAGKHCLYEMIERELKEEIEFKLVNFELFKSGCLGSFLECPD